MRDFLLFTLESQRFALDLVTVRRVVRMVEVTPLPDAPATVAGVVNVQGELLPVFDLRRRCGLPTRPPLPADHLLLAVTGERTVALAIDQAEEVFSLPEQDLIPLERILPGIDSAEGIATIAGDIVLICDLGRFLTEVEIPPEPERIGDAPS